MASCPNSDQDLVAAFLAKKAITQCPTRQGAGKSTDWLGWEPDTSETPIPPISKVRRIVGDQRREHEAALKARIAAATPGPQADGGWLFADGSRIDANGQRAPSAPVLARKAVR